MIPKRRPSFLSSCAAFFASLSDTVASVWTMTSTISFGCVRCMSFNAAETYVVAGARLFVLAGTAARTGRKRQGKGNDEDRGDEAAATLAPEGIGPVLTAAVSGTPERALAHVSRVAACIPSHLSPLSAPRRGPHEIGRRTQAYRARLVEPR